MSFSVIACLPRFRSAIPLSLSLSLSHRHTHTHTPCRHDAAHARDRDRDRSPAYLLIPCLRRDHRSAPVPLGLVLLVLMARSTRSFLLPPLAACPESCQAEGLDDPKDKVAKGCGKRKRESGAVRKRENEGGLGAGVRARQREVWARTPSAPGAETPRADPPIQPRAIQVGDCSFAICLP